MSAFLRKSGVAIALLAGTVLVCASHSQAQSGPKKVRVSIPAANVTYLPFYAAKDRGFYKEEGLEVEFILMPAALASTAVLTGDIDYNGAVTGVVAASVRGQPIKAVIFTMRSPVQGLMAKPEIKDFNNSNPKKLPSAHPVLRQTLRLDIPCGARAWNWAGIIQPSM